MGKSDRTETTEETIEKIMDRIVVRRQRANIIDLLTDKTRVKTTRLTVRFRRFKPQQQGKVWLSACSTVATVYPVCSCASEIHICTISDNGRLFGKNLLHFITKKFMNKHTDAAEQQRVQHVKSVTSSVHPHFFFRHIFKDARVL